MRAPCRFLLAGLVVLASLLPRLPPFHPLAAQASPWPGKTWQTSSDIQLLGLTELTTREGCLSPQSGSELRFGFGLGDLGGIDGLDLDLGGYLRSLEGSLEDIGIHPGFYLRPGWNFRPGKIFSLRPGLVLDVPLSFRSVETLDADGNPGAPELEVWLSPALGIDLGISFALWEGLELGLDIHCLFDISGTGLPPLLGVGLGLRQTQTKRLPIPEPDPVLQPSTLLFSPDEDGVADSLVLKLTNPAGYAVKVWTVSILDDRQTVLVSWEGEGQPPPQIQWDGRTSTGSLVESAAELRLEFHTTDVLGREARSHQAIKVDILVFKDGDNYKIRLPNIIFPANSATLDTSSAARFLEQNRQVLTRLAQIIGKFPEYQITIEGHSNATRWQDPQAWQKEQTEELIPLSAARAEAVRQALIELGIAPQRMKTVGRGASTPLAPFDSPDREKNRRVEFILVK